MKFFKPDIILVPTDFSVTADKALNKAIDLAVKVKAKLVLVHIVELSSYAVPAELISIGLVYEQMISASKESLKKLSAKIKSEHGIKVDTASYSGLVYDNIIRSAHLHNADLIIMGTHGTSGIKEWLFGSNSFSVVNNTTIPVLTINFNSDTNAFKKIIFPFNHSLLTLKKTEQVIEIAKIFHAQIFLLGYYEEDNASEISILMKKGEELANQFKKENIQTTLSFAQGDDYASEIIKYALDTKADLISIVTNRSHNVDKILSNKHDQKIVNHSIIPVLSVPVE